MPIPAGEADRERERPFEEGAHDVIDPDLRHRMISEAAYALYAERGYVDGFDIDDWLTAEAMVDHLLLGRGGSAVAAPAETSLSTSERPDGGQ